MIKNILSSTYNYLFVTVTALLLTCSGCTTIEGPPNPDDPLEGFNRTVFSFNERVDTYVYKPIAKGYNTVTPGFLNKGITNFFSNLDDFVVMINNSFQLKFNQAISDSARIVFNSTFGLFGLFDVATEFGLPKHKEDFGQTLGYYGVDSGPYLVLPFLGSSSVRDGAGFSVDTVAFDPLINSTDEPEFGEDVTLSLTSLKYLDIRADLIKASELIDEIAPDKYAFIRDAWSQRRNYLVHDGNPPDDFDEDELFDDDL